MNTSKISNLKGSVNVTVHKNYLKHDNTSSYAKVQRTTAGMNNVIAKVLNKTKLFDEASLVASAMLFKNAILELLEQGISINLLELGTLYPSAQGNIDNLNPNLSEIPDLTLGFSPSQEALQAISKAEIGMAQVEETLPVILSIEDLSTHKTDYTVSLNMPIRIRGRRLKIAGEDEEVGLYFAPKDAEGNYDKSEANWVRISSDNFFKNTASYLEVILKENLISGQTYFLVIKTASGRGCRINKSVRTLVHDIPITVV